MNLPANVRQGALPTCRVGQNNCSAMCLLQASNKANKPIITHQNTREISGNTTSALAVADKSSIPINIDKQPSPYLILFRQNIPEPTPNVKPAANAQQLSIHLRIVKQSAHALTPTAKPEQAIKQHQQSNWHENY